MAMPKQPKTPEELQKVLASYKAALEEEHGLTEGQIENLTPDELATKAREMLAKGLTTAVTTLTHLAEHATSETVKMKSSMYIIDAMVGKNAVKDPESPIDKLLAQLTANDGKGTAES